MIYVTVEQRGAGAQFSIPYLDSYTHEISRIGGFKSARFSFSTSGTVAEQWLNSALSASVVCRNEKGAIVWEGFVDSVKVSTGTVQREIGPLLDVSNNIAVSYSTPTYSGLVKSYERQTEFLYDPDSVLRYGKLTEVIAGGERTDEAASIYLDNALYNLSSPPVLDTTNSGYTPGYVVDVECAGWYRLLGKTVYRYTASTDKQELWRKIDRILERTEFASIVPGGILKSISSVSKEVEEYEDSNPTGMAAIEKAIGDVALDTADTRYIVGMFTNRHFVLDIVNTEDKYTLDANVGRFMRDGAYIDNSAVLPGTFVYSTMFSQPLLYFLESVSYNMKDDKLSTNRELRSVRAALKAVYGA